MWLAGDRGSRSGCLQEELHAALDEQEHANALRQRLEELLLLAICDALVGAIRETHALPIGLTLCLLCFGHGACGGGGAPFDCGWYSVECN